MIFILIYSFLSQSNTGNLEFSRIDGRSTEQPLKHDNVYFYGGRGISAYRVDRQTGNLTLAWDSGDIIEKATAKYLPKMHNGNNRVGDPSLTMASTFDSQSDKMVSISRFSDNPPVLTHRGGVSQSLILSKRWT